VSNVVDCPSRYAIRLCDTPLGFASPQKTLDLSHLIFSEFPHSMPLTTIRYAVANLVHLIIALSSPRKMRRIAARTIAAKMPNLMSWARTRTVKLFGNNRRGFRDSLLTTP
jgi:hypothetical protein